MKKRTKKIENIENLIKKNGYSRREFTESLIKTTAFSVIAALGLTSLLSCEKHYLEEEIESADRIPSPQKKGICLEGNSCSGGYKFHLGGSGA